MKQIFKYLIALLVSVFLSGATVLILAIINYIFVGEIPINGIFFAIIISIILYSFVTFLIAFLISKGATNFNE